MLKTMRLRGLDETALRQFVCKYSGERWEEMYESLFGYEAKRAARRTLGQERARAQPPEVRRVARRRSSTGSTGAIARPASEERERKLLAKLEAKALAAKGMDQASANRKAKRPPIGWSTRRRR